MLGLLVIIVVSWMLLHFFEKKNLKVLGIIPIKKHVIQFFIGLLFIVVLSVLWIYIETLVKSVMWEQKPIDYGLIYKAIMYHLKSALTEDLVFQRCDAVHTY